MAEASAQPIEAGQRPYPTKALSISITKNIPDTDSQINLVVARSFMARELAHHMNVP